MTLSDLMISIPAWQTKSIDEIYSCLSNPTIPVGDNQISLLEHSGITTTKEEIAEVFYSLTNPTIPYDRSFEVLVSANLQADKQLNVIASITPVALHNGKVIYKDESIRYINGALCDAILPFIEELLNGR